MHKKGVFVGVNISDKKKKKQIPFHLYACDAMRLIASFIYSSARSSNRTSSDNSLDCAHTQCGY